MLSSGSGRTREDFWKVVEFGRIPDRQTWWFEESFLVEEMGQRLNAAFLLSEGKNYQDISGATGLSTATISRVSKALKSGSGYKRAIERETDGGRTEA